MTRGLLPRPPDRRHAGAVGRRRPGAAEPARARRGAGSQFGGHCEPGDATLAGAALREARGVRRRRPRPRPGAGAPRRARRRLLRPARRACTTSTSGSLRGRRRRRRARGQRESLDVRWWPVDALPDPTSRDLVALVALARGRCAQSTSSPGGGSTLGGGRPAEQVALGPLGLRVAVDPGPERRVVAGLEQVGELVDEHVVDHPRRHPLQPRGEPDRAVAGRAGAPARASGCRPSAPTPARPGRRGSGRSAPCARCMQVVVGGPAPALGPLEPRDHGLDPLGLLPAGQRRGDQHDDPVALAVGRDGTAAPLASGVPPPRAPGSWAHGHGRDGT